MLQEPKLPVFRGVRHVAKRVAYALPPPHTLLRSESMLYHHYCLQACSVTQKTPWRYWLASLPSTSKRVPFWFRTSSVIRRMCVWRRPRMQGISPVPSFVSLPSNRGFDDFWNQYSGISLFFKMEIFAPCHDREIAWVWAPAVGSTSFCWWLTVLWRRLPVVNDEYADHSSEWITEPSFALPLYERNEGGSVSAFDDEVQAIIAQDEPEDPGLVDFRPLIPHRKADTLV